MDMMEAIARWKVCPWGVNGNKCLKNVNNSGKQCKNYIMVDPTPEITKPGPGPSGQRTLCTLFDDIEKQLKNK